MSEIVNPTYVPTGRIAVTLTANVGKFKFVTPAGALCGAGQLALGISENEHDSGELAAIVVERTCLLQIKEQLSAGALIASDLNGNGVEAEPGDYVNAILLTDAEADDIKEVYLTQFVLPEAAETPGP
jgi:hypothetical protein